MNDGGNNNDGHDGDDYSDDETDFHIAADYVCWFDWSTYTHQRAKHQKLYFWIKTFEHPDCARRTHRGLVPLQQPPVFSAAPHDERNVRATWAFAFRAVETSGSRSYLWVQRGTTFRPKLTPSLPPTRHPC